MEHNNNEQVPLLNESFIEKLKSGKIEDFSDEDKAKLEYMKDLISRIEKIKH